MPDIILNCLPPFRIDIPSAALSILKGFLNENKVDSYIKYWNIKYSAFLEKYFDGSKLNGNSIVSSFLINEFTDDSVESIRHNIMLYEFRKNQYTSFLEFKRIISELKADIKRFIYIELENEIFKSAKLFCLSYKYLQWLPGIYLSKEIKKRYPNIKIVIGGLDSKKEAFELMKVWDCFDFAIYGEGEIPLLNLYHNHDQPEKFHEIPQMVYRSKSKVIINTNKSYFNFSNSVYPNFEDYFNQIKGYRLPSDFKILLPVNAIRGCNWNTCKFCTSKNGYAYNERTPESIMEEIEYVMNKYHKYEFVFVDNSSFKNIKKLESLIEQLKKLTHEIGTTLRLELTLNHVGVNKLLIDKMYNAGVRRLQIGFESFSDRLLKLMNKKNSLADNLLFVKFALQYDIHLPLVIIKNIPEETALDVIESSNNLHFFRFYLSNKLFNFLHVQMMIQIDSIYSRKLSQEQLSEYNYYQTEDWLPENYKKNLDLSKQLFFPFIKKIVNNKREWDLFDQEMLNYKKNKFDYKTVIDNGCLYYYEFYNEQQIASIIFDEPEYLDILRLAEDKVCSMDYLYSEISSKNNKRTKEELIEMVNNLKSKYLLYVNATYTEIVSTIVIGKCN